MKNINDILRYRKIIGDRIEGKLAKSLNEDSEFRDQMSDIMISSVNLTDKINSANDDLQQKDAVLQKKMTVLRDLAKIVSDHISANLPQDVEATAIPDVPGDVRAVAVQDLSPEDIADIENSHVAPEHDHLNDLMDDTY